MRTQIEVDDVVVKVPACQNNCPADHSHLIVDDSLVGKYFRVARVFIKPGFDCVMLNFVGYPRNACAGSFRKLEKGRIPDPAARILEDA